MTSATTTDGKRWTPAITPTSGKKRDTFKKRQNRTQEKGSREETAGERGERKNHSDVEALKRKILDLPSQLNRTWQIIVPKDNDRKKSDQAKEKLEQAYNRVKQRMRQIGATLGREGV